MLQVFCSEEYKFNQEHYNKNVINIEGGYRFAIF
jgi:hypothetical protein